MYPDKCRGKSSGQVRLYKGTSTIGRAYISGSDGFGYVNQVLEPGKYTIQVTISQNSHTDAQNDFTARVYATEKVILYDTNGQASNDERVKFRTGGYLDDA